eukprot:1526866-Rhodomonas_salina.1
MREETCSGRQALLSEQYTMLVTLQVDHQWHVTALACTRCANFRTTRPPLQLQVCATTVATIADT